MAINDGNASFYEPVVNERGYVVLYPNTSHPEKLFPRTSPINPYAESKYQLFPLGTKLSQGERVWRYTLNGAAALSTLGTPVQTAAPFHAEIEDDIVVGVVAAIGDYKVSLTSTANLAAAPLSTADGFKDGYLIVNDADGEGQMYKIKSQGAASGTSQFIIELYDPLTVALTTSSEVGLCQNKYSRVIATTAALTGMPLGVNGIAVTASYYFWLGTGGPHPVNCNAAIAKTTPCVVGITAAKVDPLSVVSVTTTMIIGYMMTPGVASTEKAICDLILDR